MACESEWQDLATEAGKKKYLRSQIKPGDFF